MEKYTLSKTDLPKFIKEIMGKNRVYAPTLNDGVTLFNEINNPSDIYLDYFNSKIPPKSLLFQQTETLFKFTPGTKGTIDPPDLDDKKTVIFGIRPCDAKSFAILDHAFTTDFNDPYFINHRKNTILVGMSCTKPGVNCFCTSFNDSPTQTKYLDILLTDIGDQYLVEVTNEKGKQLANNLKKLMHPAKESNIAKKKDIEKKAIDQITRSQKTEDIAKKLDKIVIAIQHIDDDSYMEDFLIEINKRFIENFENILED